MPAPGPKNLITDIPGLLVGNSQNADIKSGTTVLLADKPFIASVDVMGGSPGTRETDLLAPDKLVEDIDALVLSGGSAFGLDAASGVADALLRSGRGHQIGPVRVPIVPAAIIFDLINGGDKNWSRNPYYGLGEEALANASTSFALGSIGAGTGALTAGLKGGLGSASLVLDDGTIVGALVVTNSTGSVVGPEGRFWAGMQEIGDEFGGLGPIQQAVAFSEAVLTKRDLVDAFTNTTIAIVATNAKLTKSQCKRLAVAAQDGMARAISPSHTPVDGDLIFSLSAGDHELGDPLMDFMRLGHAAASCLSRAIARAVYEAKPAQGDISPSWQQKFG